nr:MAG TPA: Lethal (2) giant discs 1, ENDOCYTOSIS, PROTEIN BINDING [Caudoviricetes sp.]
MRLIDADAFEKSVMFGEAEDMQDVIYALRDYPTTYDIDKVVEQLEKRMQTHERCIEYEKKNGTITEEFQQRKAVEVLKDAIEIVKVGGNIELSEHSKSQGDRTGKQKATVEAQSKAE